MKPPCGQNFMWPVFKKKKNHWLCLNTKSTFRDGLQSHSGWPDSESGLSKHKWSHTPPNGLSDRTGRLVVSGCVLLLQKKRNPWNAELEKVMVGLGLWTPIRSPGCHGDSSLPTLLAFSKADSGWTFLLSQTLTRVRSMRPCQITWRRSEMT